MINQPHLFGDERLRALLEKKVLALNEEIESQEENYILNVDIAKFAASLIDRYHLESPIIDESRIYIERSETDVVVSRGMGRFSTDGDDSIYAKRLKISYHIPFAGNSELFQYRPSSFTYSPPRADVTDNEVIVKIVETDGKMDSVKREFARNFDEIKRWLGWVSQEIDKFNRSLSDQTEIKIKERKDKLIGYDALASELGFPLKRREDSTNTYTIPEIKKKIIPKPVATTSSKLEQSISMDDYDHILGIMSNMALVMERSPTAFSTMDEDSIRMQFLVQLNSQYEGQATGETFNYEGKTDILIRAGGRNVFIAECKFWKGKKVLMETINQILKYLSWRDTKAAVILFNKNKRLTTVLSQIPAIVKDHNNFRREIEYESETGFRFVLNHKDDKDRGLYLTILVFEIPQQS